MKKKPELDDEGQRELQEMQQQFNEFDDQIKSMDLECMSKAPLKEEEPQTKIAQSDLDKIKDIYLKPYRTISSREKFNEKFREDYEFSKQYVNFIAENKEVIGETIDLWIKAFPGLPCEEWKVPVNTPVWGPRYLAERIKGCSYHKLTMENKQAIGSDYAGMYTGSIVVDSTVQRLDAYPHTKRKSVFMGSNAF